MKKRGKQRTTNKNKGEDPNEPVENDERKEPSATTSDNLDNGQKDIDNGQITEKKHEKDDDKLSQEEDENESDGEKVHEAETEGANSSSSEEEVEQDNEPEFTNQTNESLHDQPSENKAETHANKIRNNKKVPEEHKYNPRYIRIVILPILMLFCAFAAKIYFERTFTDNIDIESSVKQLANDFKNQSQYSFKKLKSRVLPYIHHKTSPQPFVLLVASTHDDHLTAECFVKRVAQLLTTVSVTINGSKYSDTTSDNAKLDIDIRLRDVFCKGKFPTAAIVQNLDSIPFGTTTLFYAYCDHDNPMYKEAAIIFTITLPENYPINDNELDRERLVEKYLSEDSPWVKDEKFSVDIMGALISRITDTVIVVNKESKESLEKSC